jgi:hypothetical protein
MKDVITAVGGSGTGYLRVAYLLTGTIVKSGNANGYGEVYVGLDRDGTGRLWPMGHRAPFNTTVSGVFSSEPLPFDWGIAFQLSVNLWAGTGTIKAGGTPESPLPPVVGSGTGTADFTMRIVHLAFFDDHLNPLTASITAASGTYTILSAPAP